MEQLLEMQLILNVKERISDGKISARQMHMKQSSKKELLFQLSLYQCKDGKVFQSIREKDK